MKYTVITSFIFWIAATGVICSQTGIQEEFLPQTATIRELQNQLNRVEDTIQTITSEEGLNRISEIRKGGRFLLSQSDIQAQALLRDILDATNLLEMAVLFYSGETVMAEEMALKVLTNNPSTGLSGKIATAELAMWFEELREASIGLISITSRPAGAMVLMNNEPFGITPLENVFIPLGSHEIKLQKDGYTTWASQVDVTKNQTRAVHSELRLNSGRLFIWTYPVGTRIQLDGKTVVSGTQPLSPYMYPFVMFLGLPPTQISQPVYLDAITPGEHVIAFDAECHQRTEFKMSIGIGDYSIPPVSLIRTRATISLQTNTPGQNVIMDGVHIGKTPLQQYSICPGHHEFKVDFGNQLTWRKTVELQDGDTRNFNCEPRPSILFLGCASPDLALALEGAMPLDRWFKSYDTFNVIDSRIANRYRYRPVVATVLEKATRSPVDTSDPTWRTSLNNMTAALLDSGASIIAFARLEPEKSDARSGQLILLHKSSGKPDILPIASGMPGNKLPDVLDKYLQRKQSFQRCRAGFRYTCLNDQVIITEIIPGGPLETSPFQTNDIITRINDIEVTDRRSVEAVLRTLNADSEVKLNCQRMDREINSSIRLSQQPVTLSLNDPHVPYSLLLALFELDDQISELPVEKVLNAGICCLALGQETTALEYFKRCILNQQPGINQGTLDYLSHIAEIRRGNKTEAQKHLDAARQSLNSTIIHGDGPLLSDVIQ